MRGFSLIELLITMAIVGILAAIALPGYSQVMNRAMRQDARLALLRVQQQQELYFATHLNYATLLGPDPSGLGLSGHSDNHQYLLELRTSADRMTYTVTANADSTGRQATDLHCARLMLDETGRRRSASNVGGWRDDDPHRCWG
jgi:type IV pilus assembly protein PilE